jgi:glycosyltransferase involved in cell wall biosynthesis
MKIIVTSLPDLKKINPQRPHHLLKYLSQKHEVTVLSVNAWWLEEKRDPYLSECLKDIEIIYMTKNRINTILQEISILKTTNFFRIADINSFDVFVSLNDLIASYILSKKVKIPMAFDICDDVPKYIKTSTQIPRLLKPFGEYIAESIMMRNIKSSKKVTFTLESLRKAYNIPVEKSAFIPNGVDTKLFCYRDSQQIKDQLGIVEDEFVLGFVGFLGEWVDIELPLFALKKLIEKNFKIKMLIIGSGDKFGYAKNLARKLGISDNVIFTGSVPYSQVPEYISFMDVCSLPFKRCEVSENALPLKLFEYMACEKPVISTPLSGVKEAVGNKVIYASDVEELVQRIIELYHNNKLIHELGKVGRRFVEQNYSWDKICDKFESVLIEASENGGCES